MFMLALLMAFSISTAVTAALFLLDWCRIETPLPVTYAQLQTTPALKRQQTTTKATTVQTALNVACELAMRDFIYSWWHQFTDDESFPTHVRGIVVDCSKRLSADIWSLNWSHLARLYVQIIRDRLVDRNPAPKSGDHAERCRHALRRLLKHVLPASERTMVILLQELITSTVMMPLMGRLEPDRVNQFIVDFFSHKSTENTIADWIEAQACSDQHDSPAQHPSTAPDDFVDHHGPIWNVAIGRTFLKFDPKPYIAYSIRIRHGQSYWEISRRYTDFAKLHSRLLNEVGCSFSGKLPKKNLRARFKKTFIETRRLDLQLYLNEVISCAKCLQTSIWYEWVTPRSSDAVYIAVPTAMATLNATGPKNDTDSIASDSEFLLQSNEELLKYGNDNPTLRYLMADLLALFKLLLSLDGNNVPFRTKTGYRLLYSLTQRLLLKQVRRWSTPEAYTELSGRILVAITSTIWPSGGVVELVEAPSDESGDLRSRAEAAVLGCIPKTVTLILGQPACRRAVRNLIDILNRRQDLTDAVLLMLEATIEQLSTTSSTMIHSAG